MYNRLFDSWNWGFSMFHNWASIVDNCNPYLDTKSTEQTAPRDVNHLKERMHKFNDCNMNAPHARLPKLCAEIAKIRTFRASASNMCGQHETPLNKCTMVLPLAQAMTHEISTRKLLSATTHHNAPPQPWCVKLSLTCVHTNS